MKKILSGVDYLKEAGKAETHETTKLCKLTKFLFWFGNGDTIHSPIHPTNNNWTPGLYKMAGMYLLINGSDIQGSTT